MVYGYARVSSAGQQLYGTSLESQEAVLIENGATKIFKEAYTGTKRDRPQLSALMDTIQSGDTLMVTKLDRFARSTMDGLQIIDDLVQRGVKINILNMGQFDSSPNGKLMRTIFLAFAEFERDMIVARTQDGKAIAKQNPDYREGRKPAKYDEYLYSELSALVDSGKMTVKDAAERLGVSRAKWYRIAKESATCT